MIDRGFAFRGSDEAKRNVKMNNNVVILKVLDRKCQHKVYIIGFDWIQTDNVGEYDLLKLKLLQ